mmetsp:Transcript_14170/g.23167  ORF Transcript_14170/g.23167 Transcript_14170/m.23167 type:complete len:81 (+) Transcript_14170:562-804(+)
MYELIAAVRTLSRPATPRLEAQRRFPKKGCIVAHASISLSIEFFLTLSQTLRLAKGAAVVRGNAEHTTSNTELMQIDAMR